MPDTPFGFTYPIATDPVAGGAAAIQALAEDVDRRFGIGTTLPAGPVNGQEFLLVNNVANPAWAIPLRYISALSKWLPTSGAVLRTHSMGTSGATASTVYIDGAANPSLTAPVAGTYDIFHSCYMTGVNYGHQSVSIGGATALDADSNIVGGMPGSTTTAMMVQHLSLGKVLAAGAVVKTQYRTNDSGVNIWGMERLLELRPVLLG